MRATIANRIPSLVACIAAFGVPGFSGAQPCPDPVPTDAWDVGHWGPVIQFGGRSEHMVLLNNGKILCLFAKATQDCVLFDPDTDSVSSTFNSARAPTGHNLICSGHVALPDGRIFFTGGHPPTWGKLTSFLHPDALDLGNWPNVGGPNGACPGCWERWFDDVSTAERFYPTVTGLSDGTSLVMAGDGLPMIYDACADPGQRWRHLDGAEYCPSGCPYNFSVFTYPFMYQLSNGRVLMAGSDDGNLALPPGGIGPQTPTRELDTTLETWTAAVLPDDIRGGSAVMYAFDRVMKAGGRPGVEDRVYTIDTSAPTPAWTQRLSLNHARKRFYLIALADGKILAVGGEDSAGAVLEPELYDPDASPEQPWQDMAPMSVPTPRMYHSSALLLPDGRVLTAGGNEAPSPGSPEPNGTVFWPPYLFEQSGPGSVCAARPVIESVIGQAGADVVQYDETFTVTLSTPLPNDVTAVNLIRPGGATHGYDFEQRFASLSFEPGLETGEWSVEAPATANDAPPGSYMLFILDDDGVPSKAAFVKLEASTDPVDPPTSFPVRFPENRYMAFWPRNTGQTTALRVTFNDLPSPFTSHEGEIMWVGDPKVFCENSGQIQPPRGGCAGAPGVPLTFIGAKLQCTPDYRDWGALGTLQVYAQEIVPSARYKVQAIESGADESVESNYSCPLFLDTPLWGDIAGNLATCPPTGPDGSVDILPDVTAVIDKFGNRPCAVIKARADVEPAFPDRQINISDITRVLDAFSGIPYPFPWSSGCP